MRFKADEIVSVLQTEIEQYRGQLDAREVGRVLEVGDGIARVYGLSGVMAGEMVDFKRTGVKGLAFNLEENSVGVIILGEYLEIAEGDEVTTTGQLLRVPVGDALIGRVVDPLGNPLDAKGPVVSNASRALESVAPKAITAICLATLAYLDRTASRTSLMVRTPPIDGCRWVDRITTHR